MQLAHCCRMPPEKQTQAARRGAPLGEETSMRQAPLPSSTRRRISTWATLARLSAGPNLRISWCELALGMCQVACIWLCSQCKAATGS